MKKYLILGLCLFTKILSAQKNNNTNITNENKIEIGGQLLGPTKVISTFVNYYLNDKINIELGAGILGFYSGINYFFKKHSSSNWRPYLGAYYSRAETIIGTCNCSSGLNPTAMRSGIYIPIGIKHLATNGFIFSPEISVYFKYNAKYSLKPWGSLKLGYQFK
jgi:hypothetical protein